MIRLLCVNTNEAFRSTLNEAMVDQAVWMGCATGLEMAEELIKAQSCDVIVVDLEASDFAIHDLFAVLRHSGKGADTPVLVLGTENGEEVLTEAIEAGASDLLYLPAKKLEIKARLEALNRYKQVMDDFNARLFMDSVTDLPNRMALMGELTVGLHRMKVEKFPVSVMRMTVLNLKTINSTHGHRYGDQALRDIAEKVNSQIHGQAKLFRGDGSELLILGVGMGLDAASNMSRRVLSTVSEMKVDLDGEMSDISLCAGVSSILPEEEPDQRRLLAMTDEALLTAVEQGPGQVVTLTLQGKDWLG